MNVDRNAFSKPTAEQILASHAERIGREIALVHERGEHQLLGGLSSAYLRSFCSAAALNHPVEAQLVHLDSFIESRLAACELATHVGKTVAIEFQGRTIHAIAEAREYSVSENGWITGFMAALARRKMKTVHRFCAVDVALLHQKKEAPGGAYSLLLAVFLQRLFNKGEPHGRNLLAAANEIKEDRMPDLTYEYALHIDGPLIDMFTPVFMNDQADFSAMLLNGLTLHKKYWGGERSSVPEGLVSLPITAIAVMAKDYDIEIEHASDYLVQHLIDG